MLYYQSLFISTLCMTCLQSLMLLHLPSNIDDCLSMLDLVGVGSHVTALGQYYVLTMMESSVLDFLEHPEDGKLTQLRWNVLRNSRLETGFVFVRLLHLQSMD